MNIGKAYKWVILLVVGLSAYTAAVGVLSVTFSNNALVFRGSQRKDILNFVFQL